MAFSTPKTKGGERSVALDPITVATLRAHRTAHLEERMALGFGKLGVNALVFTSDGDAPVHPSLLTDTFERRAKASGLPVIRVHGRST
jgi:hypothetical protein